MNELDLLEKINLAQVVEKEESDFNMGLKHFFQPYMVTLANLISRIGKRQRMPLTCCDARPIFGMITF